MRDACAKQATQDLLRMEDPWIKQYENLPKKIPCSILGFFYKRSNFVANVLDI